MRVVMSQVAKDAATKQNEGRESGGCDTLTVKVSQPDAYACGELACL